jgi:hypothetical protein
MATTTNYSWSTPDDTALVKDGAAAIRTLGSSADTTVKALNPGTTAGDVDYYTTSTAKARLAIGTAGQLLRVNSGATAPEWATVSSGGMTLISTTTLSGATTDLTSIPQTYNSLFLVVTGMTANTSDKLFLMQPNADTSGVIYWNSLLNSTGIHNTGSGSVQLSGDVNTSRVDDDNVWAIRIDNYTDTAQYKIIGFNGYFFTTGGSGRGIIGNAAYLSASAVTSIRFTYQGTNTFAGGTVLLYGVK